MDLNSSLRVYGLQEAIRKNIERNNWKQQLDSKNKMRRNVTRTGTIDKELVSSVDGVKIKDIIVGNKVLKTMEVDRDPALSCD